MRAWIPNSLTLSGALSAMLALMWAPSEPRWACYALIASALFDMVDGRVARALGVSGDFGKELDNLVDIVAFGVAPAYLAYSLALHKLGTLSTIPLAIAPVAFFVSATALRLARFAVEPQPKGAFLGIPTPIAALLPVTAIMASFEMNWPLLRSLEFIVGILLCASVLMLVPWRFPSFKSFENKVLMVLYFGSMACGLAMLVLGLPGGLVLFCAVVAYVARGIAGALTTALKDTRA